MERVEPGQAVDLAPVDAQRRQLAKVLASHEFEGSPHARKFLEYVTDRLFAGDCQIDQADIARHVLARNKDFDPTTDASVRKLAMQVRQRLERYYAGPGAYDPLILSLPLRSYIPAFDARPDGPAVDPGERSKRLFRLLAAGAVVTFGAGVLWLAFHRRADEQRIVISTRRGDICSPRPDMAEGALRLMAPAAQSEDYTVLLSFPADHEGQHAGLVIWDGPRRFVSVGRRFTSRNFVTFGHEYDTYFGDRPDGEVEDPSAQSGTPLWLRLSKHWDTYSAFTSMDGMKWQPVGLSLTLPAPFKHPRFGIFAFNGRRDSPSRSAAFEFLGKGLVLPGELTASGPWTSQSDCPEGAAIFDGVRGPEGALLCNATWSKKASDSPWSLTARLDLLANTGVTAGLFLQTENRRFRLVREYSDGPKIEWIQDGVKLESNPDFPGSPPLYLRMSLASNKLEGEVSLNGRDFMPVGKTVEIGSAGSLKSYGIIASRHSRQDDPAPAPLHIPFVREDLLPLAGR